MSNLRRVETVNFMGDALAVVREGEQVRAVLKPMCDALGLASNKQALKLEQSGWAALARTVSTGADGKSYEMLTLDLDSVPMWLATIQVSRVAKSMQPKLLQYQLHCAKVLRDHFSGAPQEAAIRVIDSGPRIGDSPEGRAEVRRRCEVTARACGSTLRAVLGFVRRMARTSSPYFATDMYWRTCLLPMLDDLAMGKLFLSKRRAAGLLGADSRQIKMFSSN